MKPLKGRLKYEIPRGKRKALMVDTETYETVKAFAGENGITMVEAAYFLLGRGSAQLYDVPGKKPWWPLRRQNPFFRQ